MDIEPLLSDFDLERITGRKRSCWQKDRLRGGPATIPFVKVGKLVRYRPQDVVAWIERQIRRSTSDTGPAK